MGNACISPPADEPVLATVPPRRAVGSNKPACVKKLLIDERDQNVLYAGSWDALARRYDLRTGELTLAYAGCMADIIDMAQCTTPEGHHLLFAAPCGPPGICCWLRDTAQLVRVFALDAALASPHGAFSAYGLEATSTTLFCGHAFKGVMSWPVAGSALREDGQATIVSNPRFFSAKGPLETERGPASLVSSNGAMALALSPADAPGRRQLLATGHIVELNVLLSLPGSEASVPPAATLMEAADANARQHSGSFGLFIWDAESALCLSLLGFRHHAALRAVEWCGGAESLVSGDLNGLVLQWSVPGRCVLRQFPPHQARCRVLLVASPGPLPLRAAPTGAPARAQQRDNSTLILCGSDEGPPLVAHTLLDVSAPTLATASGGAVTAAEADVPAEAAAPAAGSTAAAAAGTAAASSPRVPEAFELLPPFTMLPAAAHNSLYSIAQTSSLFVTGHKMGEIYAWSRQTGHLSKALGTAGPAKDSNVARAAPGPEDSPMLAIVMPGATEGSHIARERDVYLPYRAPY